MNLEYHEYRAKKIVNTYKHVDAWFWNKYSAHPYIGCRSGCAFCYLRGERYLGKRDPEKFDRFIQVKTNAVELLRNELARLQPDVINAGDWQQPAEQTYRLSRVMLEVVHEFQFPLLVIERSPFLLRDLDLLDAINRQTWVGVFLSFSNVDETLKRFFEPHSPSIKRRLQMMAQLAEKNIRVGASLMPILPIVGDTDLHIEETIRAVKDHGGTFVVGGSLTLDGVQAQHTLAAYKEYDAAAAPRLRELYGWHTHSIPTYGPPGAYAQRIALRVRELCVKHGIADRMPRYCGTGTLASNKRIAELLHLKVYELELARAPVPRLWTYRKAAWQVDELRESVADIFAAHGEAGLRALPAIGDSIAREIAQWLLTETSVPTTP
jgi:DNA repair photolyase